MIEQEDDLRRALRGPFPWSDGPTAGFSCAAPEQLYQPLNDDASSHNAHFAAQWDDPDSWLHFHRRVNTLVRRYPALTAGDFDVLDEMPAGSVWGCVRTDENDSLIGVCNLGEADVQITSALPKHTRSQWRGAVLRDVLRGGRAGSVDQTGRLDLVVPAGGYVVAGRAS